MISGSFTIQTKPHSEATSGDASGPSLPLIATGSVSPLLQSGSTVSPTNANGPSSANNSNAGSISNVMSPLPRERHRSLSVDLVNQPSSMLLRDRNSTITVPSFNLSHI